MRFSMTDTMLKGVVGLASPSGRRARLSILIYHRVLAQDDPINNWDATAGVFEAHMRALAANFSPLLLSDAVARLANGSLPARAACVTFDDGYADNVEVALPILMRHGIRAAFFIASGYLTGRRMWNDTVVEAVRRRHGLGWQHSFATVPHVTQPCNHLTSESLARYPDFIAELPSEP